MASRKGKAKAATERKGGPVAELTVKGVIVGIFLSVLLGAANMYTGLRAGLTVSASIPAAVMSYAMLRAFPKKTIQENNIVQTIASAASSLSAGIIFTIPALLFLEVWQDLHIFETMVIALSGGLLGVLFSVPLRKPLIEDQKLAFPEGTACAAVLKAGYGGGGASLLLAGAVAGATFAFIQLGLDVYPTTADIGARIGSTIAYAGTELSLILLGVGFIVGIRIASLIFAGGAFAWWFVLPILAAFGPSLPITMPDTSGLSATDAAGAIWTTKIRLVGAGAMFVGGVLALVKLRQPLSTAFRGGFKKFKSGAKATKIEDIPLPIIVIGIAALLVPLTLLAINALPSAWMAFPAILVILVAGFLLSAVAGYMAGLVGSSNNPVSGVTIIALTGIGLMLLAFGVEGSAGMLGALIVASAIATAAAISGDNLQDLKTGQLVKATPWKQQVSLMIGVVSLGIAAPFILNLLDQAFGLPSDTLPAPQAGLMATILTAIFGAGLDYVMMGFGALAAIGVGAAGLPVLPIAVGAYLPLGLSVPIFAGGVLRWWVGRVAARRGADPEAVDNRGTVLASGVIAGEAVAGIVLAQLIVLDAEVGSAWTPVISTAVVGILGAVGALLIFGRSTRSMAVAGVLLVGGLTAAAWTYVRGEPFPLTAGPFVGLIVMLYGAMVITYLALRPHAREDRAEGGPGGAPRRSRGRRDDAVTSASEREARG